MKFVALTLIFIFLVFTGFGYTISQLFAERQENSRLAEQLQSAQAGLAAQQAASTEALAVANARTGHAEAELAVYKQLLGNMAEENAALHRKVHDLETASAAQNASAEPTPAPRVACPEATPSAFHSWEPLVQSTVAVIVALVIRFARQPPARPQRDQGNSNGHEQPGPGAKKLVIGGRGWRSVHAHK